MHPQVAFLLGLLLTLSSCVTSASKDILQPKITYSADPYKIQSLPSAFSPLSEEEKAEGWSKEYILGHAFAKEMDLYRAITCYKSALILLPEDRIERRLELTYDIMLSYYLGNKYQDVVNTFETSELTHVNPLFPAFNNLLLILYDSYRETDQCDKAETLYETIGKCSPETGEDLALYDAVLEGDLTSTQTIACSHRDSVEIQPFIDAYYTNALKPSKARFLNAVLPGAGYYYVGQKKAALTSFIINALFTAATVQLFCNHYYAAGAIVGSMELGWYYGGINGAGIEAQEYNNQLFHGAGKRMLCERKIFPVLMFQTAF